MRRILVILATVAAAGLSFTGVGFAHNPHAPQVRVTWHNHHMEGWIAAVQHGAIHEQYVSGASTLGLAGHAAERFKVWVYWADRKCVFTWCFWDTQGGKSAENADPGWAIDSGDLDFVATSCRLYKFYSEHKNLTHNSPVLSLDEPEGVQAFRAPALCQDPVS